MSEFRSAVWCRPKVRRVGGFRTAIAILTGGVLLLGLVMDAAARLQPRYCVAQRDASEDSVKAAINWACNQGKVKNPACSESICMTTYDRADVVFTVYYKQFQKQQQDSACDFLGAAQLSTGEPNKFFNFATNTLKPCS